MAQPTNTFATNDMVGIREDLADVIYDISPTETPFMNGIPHVQATATLHEWQTDSLAAAANNAVIEGDDATTDARSATVRLTNHTQISDKVPRVSGSARAVTTAGRADEFDLQMLKSGRELRRDMETALLSNKAKVAGNDTLARELAGIGAWITTNDDLAGDGSSPTAADGTDARNDGTQRAFTEAQLKNVVKLIAEEGGSPTVISMGSFNKQVFSGFTGNSTRMQTTDNGVLSSAIDVYKSDFGELRAVFNRFQRARDALVLDMDMWAVAFLRNFTTTDLAKTGDSDRRQILSEYTLESRNEKASGGVFDLTVS